MNETPLHAGTERLKRDGDGLLMKEGKPQPSFVFTQFSDNGWHNLGLSTLSGITAGINPLIGADGAVHMSEGEQNPPPPSHRPSLKDKTSQN